MRYPASTQTCTNCKIRGAMFNDDLCGACAEELEAPSRQESCRSCGAPHSVFIHRALAFPQFWIKASGNNYDEPGFGRAQKSLLLDSGLCRWCHNHRLQGVKK